MLKDISSDSGVIQGEKREELHHLMWWLSLFKLIQMKSKETFRSKVQWPRVIAQKRNICFIMEILLDNAAQKVGSLRLGHQGHTARLAPSKLGRALGSQVSRHPCLCP